MNRTKNLLVPQYDQEEVYSCIPACLQQVFQYYKKHITQQEILGTLKNPTKGMSVPKAGLFAKRYGFYPTIVTNNISIFDPVWFQLNNKKLIQNLGRRRKFVNTYYQSLIDDYVAYFKMGGHIAFNTIKRALLVQSLYRNTPVIAELSSTFLYKKSKSIKPGHFDSPFQGEIDGHGVVVAGFSKNKFKIVDPDSKNNPYGKKGTYWILADELIASIFIAEGKSLLLIHNDTSKEDARTKEE